MLTRIYEVVSEALAGVSEVFWFLTDEFNVLGFDVSLFDFFSLTGLIAFLGIVLVRFFV